MVIMRLLKKVLIWLLTVLNIEESCSYCTIFPYPFIDCSCIVLHVLSSTQVLYIFKFTFWIMYPPVFLLQNRSVQTLLNVTVIPVHLTIFLYVKVVTVHAITHAHTITSATAILLHLIKYLPVYMDNARVNIQVTIYPRTWLHWLFTD